MSTSQTQNFTCFIMGEGSLLTSCAEILQRLNCHIHGLISPNTENRKWAEQQRIPSVHPRENLLAFMNQHSFDYLFSIVNAYLLPPEILKLPKKYAINYHDSLLPKYAGVHATAWAIVNQEKQHGITWHLMTEKIDGGHIVKQSIADIASDDTSLTLNLKCFERAIQSFESMVEDLKDDRVDLIPQDLSQRTYYSLHKRPPSAGIISFNQEAAAIDAFVRALTFGESYPNRLGTAKIVVDGEFFIISKLSQTNTISREKAGTVIHVDDNSIIVSTLTENVAIEQLLSIEGTVISIKEFVENSNLKKGTELTAPEQKILDQWSVFNEQLSKNEAYWAKKLEDIQPINIPYLKPISSLSNWESVYFPFTIPDEFVSFLDKSSDDKDIRISLLTAYMAYLGRLSRVSRFDIGFVPEESVDWAEGFFAAQVPLRIDFNSSLTFNEFRAVVKKEINQICKHETYACDILARYPALGPVSSNSSLTQVSVAFVKTLKDYKDSESYGLTFVIAPSSGESMWIYRPDVLDPTDANKMMAQFRCFLEGLTNFSEQQLRYLPLMTEKEHNLILVDWNSGETYYPKDKCIHQLFEEWAEREPDEIAVVSEGELITYKELNNKANQLANYLIKQGIGPDKLVGLCLERSILMIIAMLGVLKAGGAYVPLEPDYPEERLVFMLEDAEVHTLITEEQSAALFESHKLPRVILDKNFKNLRNEDKDNPTCELSSENLAYVIYTSGSTGKPKGVMITHHNVVGFLFSYKQVTLDGEKRKGTTVAPFSFDTSVEEIYSTICFGGTLHIIQPENSADFEYFARYLVNHQITTSYILPDFLTGVATQLRKMKEKINLRCVITGLVPKKESVLQSFRQLSEDIRILNAYGPTEVTYGATAFNFHIAADPDHDVPIGVPFPNYETYIVDADLQPVPIGVPGELLIGGVGIARGYLNHPQLTAEKFILHPFSDEPGTRLYKTGDLTRFLPDGNIEFLGRIDHQVKIRGYRIELGEIESVLDQHPAVEKVVVLDKEVMPGDKRLIAYFQKKSDEELNIGEIRHFLKSKLPPYMIPSNFIQMDSIPLQPSGKVDRKRLPEPDDLRPNLENAFVSPRDKLELQLTKIWENVLGVRNIGIKDNLFDLGGDSLLATRLSSQIQKIFGKYLPPAVIYQAPNVEQLANVLRQKGCSTTWSSLVPIQPSGSKPPFFCIHPHSGYTVYYRDLARCLGVDQPFYGIQAIDLSEKQFDTFQFENIAAHYINEIRTVQPNGPYYLGGLCLGGTLAFEMAQQLQDENEEVALLVMIGCTLPPYPKYLPRTTAFHHLIYRITERVDREVSVFFEVEPNEKLSYLVRRIQRFLIVMYEKIEKTLRPYLTKLGLRMRSSPVNPMEAIEEAYMKAYENYRPKPYQGQVALFKSRKQPLGIYPDPTLGWDELIKSNPKIIEIPGYPDQRILLEPRVRIVAKRLKACLHKAQCEHDPQKTHTHP